MKRTFLAALAISAALALGFGCSEPAKPKIQRGKLEQEVSNEVTLRRARHIRMDSRGLFESSGYDLSVDGETVAAMYGTSALHSDNGFFIKTNDGKMLGHDLETKEFLSHNISAIIYDRNNNVVGRLEERACAGFFNTKHKYSYFGSKNPIGSSQQVESTGWEYMEIYDQNLKLVYIISQKSHWFDSWYDIAILNKESTVPLEYALFTAAIEWELTSAAEAARQAANN